MPLHPTSSSLLNRLMFSPILNVISSSLHCLPFPPWTKTYLCHLTPSESSTESREVFPSQSLHPIPTSGSGVEGPHCADEMWTVWIFSIPCFTCPSSGGIWWNYQHENILYLEITLWTSWDQGPYVHCPLCSPSLGNMVCEALTRCLVLYELAQMHCNSSNSPREESILLFPLWQLKNLEFRGIKQNIPSKTAC